MWLIASACFNVYDEKNTVRMKICSANRKISSFFSFVFHCVPFVCGTSLVFYGSNAWFRTFFYSKLKSCRNLYSFRVDENSAFYLDKYTLGLLLLPSTVSTLSSKHIQNNNSMYSNSISCKQTCQISQLRNDVRAQDLNEIVNFSNWETRSKHLTIITLHHTYLSLLMKTFHTHHFSDGKSGFYSAKNKCWKLHFHFWHHISFRFIEVRMRRGASQPALRRRCCCHRRRPRHHGFSQKTSKLLQTIRHMYDKSEAERKTIFEIMNSYYIWQHLQCKFYIPTYQRSILVCQTLDGSRDVFKTINYA